MRPATDKQRAFIAKLRDERVLHPAVIEKVDTRLADDDLDTATASVMIDYLIQHPLIEGVTPAGTGLDISSLRSGRYAVGDVLIKIDNMTEADAGKWVGWVFVKNGSQYIDERFGSQRPGNHYFGKYPDLLAAVLEDPQAAMQHYGRITGSCAVCGRPLEDEVSVARGIGPVCWEKVA